MARPTPQPPLKIVACRLPETLIDQAQRYADLYHTSLSALLREGLEWRLRQAQQCQAGDSETALPAATRALLTRLAATLSATAAELRTACPDATETRESNGHTPQLPEASISDTEAMEQAYNGITLSVSEPYNGNTKDMNELGDETTESTPEPSNGMTPQEEVPLAEAVQPSAIPPYDAHKYTLGELCAHSHDYHNTGQSLRRLSDRECLECHRARARAYRQRQRQAQPATLGQARIAGAQDRSPEEKRPPAQRTSAASVPPFDPVKHHLGKLCAHGHAWGSSGQSLRANNKAGYCLACNAALNKAKRHAQPA